MYIYFQRCFQSVLAALKSARLLRLNISCSKSLMQNEFVRSTTISSIKWILRKIHKVKRLHFCRKLKKLNMLCLNISCCTHKTIVSIFVELGICIVSMRGSILDTGPRATMHYWLYMKLGTFRKMHRVKLK